MAKRRYQAITSEYVTSEQCIVRSVHRTFAEATRSARRRNRKLLAPFCVPIGLSYFGRTPKPGQMLDIEEYPTGIIAVRKP